MGDGLYDMEAFNVLRIEKRFITHGGIHGRATANDIGFGHMVSQKKNVSAMRCHYDWACWILSVNSLSRYRSLLKRMVG
jgi:hypothetical protein